MSGNTVHASIVEELKKGNTVTYFTLGVSMRPLLTERKTHVTIVPISSVKNGDILLYVRSNGSLVLHRCIKMDADCYYMRGDNTYGLERIEKEQAVGVAAYIYRGGKSFGVGNRRYRAYVCLWNLLYPFRLFCRSAKCAVHRAMHFISK